MHKEIRYFAAMTVLLSVIAYCFLHACLLKQIAVLNKKALFAQYVAELSQHRLNEEEMYAHTAKFRKSLDLALQTYASKHHTVIFDKKTVLAWDIDNTRDITSDIKVLVASLMREKT